MRILSTIWPDVTADVMVFALHHDSGELGSGDIPYPHKAQNPELKSIMDGLEEVSLADQGLVVPEPGHRWRWRVKTADMIEMFEKGLDEILLGNRYGIPVMRAMEAHIRERCLGHMDLPAVERYMEARWAKYRLVENMK